MNTKNNFPLLSIVVLSYNRLDIMKQSLESLWENTTIPYELIITDDGSTDGSREYLFELLRDKKVSAVYYNNGKNMGVGRMINVGFDLASGDLLMKADADLIYKPKWGEEVQEIMKNQKVGCLGLFKYWHDPVDHNKMNPKLRIEGEGLENEKIKVRHFFEVDDFVSSAFITPKKLYKRYGIEQFSDAFAEDVGYKNILKKGGYKLALTEEDYAENIGFGLDRSTLFTEDSTSENIKVVKVHKEPLIFNKEKM